MKKSSSFIGTMSIERNTEWLRNSNFWVFYCIITALLLLAFKFSPFEIFRDYSYSMVHNFHAISNFIIFHTIKGAPFESHYSNRIEDLTFWEQIQDTAIGSHLFSVSKFLTIFPVGLYLLTFYETDYALNILSLLNAATFLLVFLPKIYYFISKQPKAE